MKKTKTVACWVKYMRVLVAFLESTLSKGMPPVRNESEAT
jgi:hypothetical protein